MNLSDRIKSDFPIFQHEPNLVYLDSAATALKPQCVIDREREYYEQYPANISRGLYPLSERATTEYEATRDTVTKWIGAPREEIIFTRGTTESINLLSYALEKKIGRDDTIVVTAMDHHANFLPWQALAERTGATFRVIPISQGEIDTAALHSIVDVKTKVFAFPFISNVLGTVNPVSNITAAVRSLAPKALIVLDAAQAAPHQTINVGQLGADFLAFSAHKCFGPTGVGVLWGKYSLLESLPPFLYGGDMVEHANIKGSTFKQPPHRFEAGTPNISGVIAFRAALEYLQKIGMNKIEAHEKELTRYARKKLLEAFPDIHFLESQNPDQRSGIISFALPDVHAHDIADTLGKHHIAVRAGAHCAHPLHDSLGIAASVRISISIYNSEEDIDRTIEGIQEARRLFSKPRKKD